MFETMLVPLDQSRLGECVLPHAAALARVFDSHITLMHVLEASSHAQFARAIDPLQWQLIKAEAESYLTNAETRLAGAGLSVSKRLEEGLATEQILEFAGIHHPHLILLGSHYQPGLTWKTSSMVQNIALHDYTSFMMVRAGPPSGDVEVESADVANLRYQKLLVPLDGSQRAECVLPVVTALARAHQAKIILAHVVQRPAMPRRTPLSRDDSQLSDSLVERNQIEAEQYLEQLRERLNGEAENAETRVIISDPLTGALLSLAEQENVDLVIASAHGYSGQARWPFGSVATSLIAYGALPLLVVQDASPSNGTSRQASIEVPLRYAHDIRAERAMAN